MVRTASAMRLVYPEMVRLPTDVDDHRVCFDDVASALEWLDGEIGCLVGMIEGVARGAHRARSWQLADQLRGYFFIRRDFARWLAAGLAGLAAAEATGDLVAQAAMHQTIGQAHWSTGRHDLALSAYRRGIDAARAGGWPLGEAYMLHNLGLVHAELGQVDEARELYRSVLLIGESTEFNHVRAVTLNDLGVMCSQQGRLDEAVQHLRMAMHINQGMNRRPSAAANAGNLGMVLRQLEQFDDAHRHLHEVLTYYCDIGSANGQMAVLDELSQLHQQRGEWHPAVNDATTALRIAEEADDVKSRAGVLNTLGFALLGARALSDARARFETSLQLSRTHGYKYYEAQAGIGVAETLLSAGEVSRSIISAGEALEVARRNQYSVLIGDAAIALARAELRNGDHVAAAGHCRAARAAYETAGVPTKLRAVDRLTTELATTGEAAA